MLSYRLFLRQNISLAQLIIAMLITVFILTSRISMVFKAANRAKLQ